MSSLLLQNNFSLIVPTYHEAKNISELIQRIANIHFNVAAFEVIIVDDDSQDGIIGIVEQLQMQYPWLQIIIRREQKSLSAAVITGCQHARYPIIIIMDADLSHPPEKIPALLAALSDPTVDIVIGSRYVPGGSVDSAWPLMRRIASKCAAAVARIVLNQMVSDPLSGFIGIRKNKLISGSPLNPIGWKISLELMVKCHCSVIKEVPIHFAERKLGKSKLSLSVLIDYLLHIKNLISYKLFSSKLDSDL